MSHGITVGIRMRPMVQHEAGQAPCFELTEPNDVDVLTGASGVSQPKGFEGPWRFDHAMDSSVPQGSTALFTDNDTCYEKMGKPMLQQSLEGYNVCLFCYGQTGTGKTTTVMGDAEHGDGVLVKLLRDLFVEMEKFRAEGATCDVSVQILEVYNETVHDLLQHNREEMLKTKVNVHLLPRGVSVQGAMSKAVENVDECMKLIEHANKLKTMYPTAMNPQSSRGHVIFKLFFHKSGGPDGMLLDSEIYFADLAGHENEKTTHVTGDRFKELTFINKSLMWLQNAIHGLAKPHKDHVEMGMFRNSKLTLILSPALTGNSRTAIIVTLSPAAAYFETSIASLKFAVEAKRIKVDAKAHKSADPYVHIKELEEEVRELKAEIKELKERLAVAEAGGGPPPAAADGAATGAGAPESRQLAAANLSSTSRGPPGSGGPATVTAGETDAPAAAASQSGRQPATSSTSAAAGRPRSPRGAATAPQAKGKAAAAKRSSGAGAQSASARGGPPSSARGGGSTRRGAAATTQAQGKAAATRRSNTTPTGTAPLTASERAAAADGSEDAPEVTGPVTSPDDSFDWAAGNGSGGADSPDVPGGAGLETQRKISGLLEEVRQEVEKAFGQQPLGQDNFSFDMMLTDTSRRGQAEDGTELDRKIQSLQMSMQLLQEQLRMLSLPGKDSASLHQLLQDTLAGTIAGDPGRTSVDTSDGGLQQALHPEGRAVGISATDSLQPLHHLDGTAASGTAASVVSTGGDPRQQQPPPRILSAQLTHPQLSTAAAGQRVEGVQLGSPGQLLRSTSVDAAARASHLHPGSAAYHLQHLQQQQAMGPHAAGMPHPVWATAAPGQRGRFQVAAMPQTLTASSWSREGTPRGDRVAAMAAAQYHYRAPDLHYGGFPHAAACGAPLSIDASHSHSHLVVRRFSPMMGGPGATVHPAQPQPPHMAEGVHPGTVVVTAPLSRTRQPSLVRATTGSAAERTSADNSPSAGRR